LILVDDKVYATLYLDEDHTVLAISVPDRLDGRPLAVNQKAEGRVQDLVKVEHSKVFKAGTATSKDGVNVTRVVLTLAFSICRWFKYQYQVDE
jgi:hypothetical protein